ncbi:MAG: helix-turn-helix domain-containing protein [Candidatus Marinimicrobia bacterium]|nr:helix-turn-helix domain-containing protein [Candidatus Neomarinimicrobiota bacterium]
MKTAGQILKEKREERTLELDQVAQETKIRKEFLKAIEKNDYSSLPSVITSKGFIRNYAQFLGLDPERLVAVFKRDFRQDKEPKPFFPLKKDLSKEFKWNPKKTLILVVVLFVFGLFVYLGFQYRNLVGRPDLRIDSPSDNQTVTEEQILLSGRTDPDNAVSVNGDLTQLSPQGEFSYRLRLNEGENKIVIETTNRSGKKTRLTRTVFYSTVQEHPETSGMN